MRVSDPSLQRVSLTGSEARRIRWSMVVESLTRPYPVTIPMVLLVLLVPFYIVIGQLMPGWCTRWRSRRVRHRAKQHYVLDVIAGIFLAGVAYVVFLRNYPGEEIPELDRRLAPVFALGIIGIIGLAFACFWVAYRMSGAA